MSDTLRCSTCQRALPVDEFSRSRKNRFRGGRHYSCRECDSNKSHLLLKRNRQLVLEAKDVPCMDCGVRWPFWIMEFDHRDPSKKDFEIGSEGRQFSKQKVKDEMAKCDIVCANCHKDREYKRLQEKLERGESVGCIVPRGTRRVPKTQTPSLPDAPALY